MDEQKISGCEVTQGGHLEACECTPVHDFLTCTELDGDPCGECWEEGAELYQQYRYEVSAGETLGWVEWVQEGRRMEEVELHVNAYAAGVE